MYQTIYYLLVNTPFLVALFWITFILRSPYPKDRTRRVVLLAYMVNVAILLFASSAFFQANTEFYNIAKVLQICTLVNAFPLYFMYIKLITCCVKFNKKHLLMLMPGVVLSILCAMLLYSSPKDVVGQIHDIFQHGHSFNRNVIWQVKALFAIDLTATGIILTSTILMLLNIKKSLQQYKDAISQYYADAPNKVRGLNLEIFVGAVYSVVVVFGSLFAGVEIYNYNLIAMLVVVLISVFPIFIVGNHSQFNMFNIADFDKQIKKDSPELANEIVTPYYKGNSKDDSEQTGLSDENLIYLAERIVEAVESRQLYLNPDLRITDISNVLSTNRTYISQAINLKLGGNFSDFINNYRIEHTKRLLTDPSYYNFTIEAIAEDSGYATVASLNRLFKLKTGFTPNQYRHANILDNVGKRS